MLTPWFEGEVCVDKGCPDLVIDDGDNTIRRCRAGTCCPADGVYQIDKCVKGGFKNGWYKISGGCTVTVKCFWYNKPAVQIIKCWNIIFQRRQYCKGGCQDKVYENWRKGWSDVDQIPRPEDFDPSHELLPPYQEPQPLTPEQTAEIGMYQDMWSFGPGFFQPTPGSQ